MNWSKFQNRTLIAALVCFIVVLLLAVSILSVTKDNNAKFTPMFVTFSVIAVAGFATYEIVLMKKTDKEDQEASNETIKKLSSEFNDFYLKDTDLISKDNFKCKARLNENGDVVCEIKADIEMILPIKKFSNYFTD
ncbi:MAG: hypothetical protein J5507_02775 [Clostridia bacterium]|nr:hypothetical protein [Clostridia bacterium]